MWGGVGGSLQTESPSFYSFCCWEKSTFTQCVSPGTQQVVWAGAGTGTSASVTAGGEGAPVRVPVEEKGQPLPLSDPGTRGANTSAGMTCLGWRGADGWGSTRNPALSLLWIFPDTTSFEVLSYFPESSPLGCHLQGCCQPPAASARNTVGAKITFPFAHV